MINCMETHKYVHIVLLCVRACVCVSKTAQLKQTFL